MFFFRFLSKNQQFFPLALSFFSKTHQSSLTLNEGFFLKSPRPSFIDKAGCTRQFESELSLRSFAQLFPINEGFFENPPVLPYP